MYIVPGEQIGSLAEFYTVMGEVINGPGGYFGANLDAFVDCLRGGFGTPDGPYALRWVNSAHSRETLSYSATAQWMADRGQHAHESSHAHFAMRLEEARQGRGETLFDMLVSIIHEADGVRLELV